MTSFFTHVLRFRLLIAAAAIGVLTLGVLQLRNSPVDVLPEFTPPYAEIQTEALGLSAEEVEQLITVPLEADLLNGVEGVEVIRSDSVPGLSSIVMVFAKGTDIYEARLLIQERLTQAHALPNVSRPPTLLPPLSSSNRVLMIGLSSTELSPIEQSVLARWTVRPQLMGVPGVANVSIWGLRDQQLQVQVDPATLANRKVTLNQIVRTTGNAQVVSPLSFLEASTPGTGGFIESPQQRLQVRHLLERIADPAELAKVPVEGTNGALQLGDVSTIVVDHQPLIGDAVVNDGPGLLLVVEKFPGVSTLEVTEGVENALETLRPGLTGMSTDTSVFRPADYISDALDNIGLALLIGGILMLAALLALRLQWRAVVVAVITVPLSVITAALILRALGQEMNALVLAGLAAALTIVVDEAVTPADHALRRLREQQFEPEPESVPESVAQGWTATRRPLVYATVIIGLAIVPAAVIDGRPGAFLAPLIAAYAVAVASAFLVAIVVAPALTMLLLRSAKPGGLGSGNAFERVSRGYQSALTRFSASIRPVILAAAACAIVAAVALPFLSPSLIPSFRDRNIALQLEGPPGSVAGVDGDPDDRGQSRRAERARCHGRGRAPGAGDRWRPDRQRELRRRLGEHRSRCRLRRDGQAAAGVRTRPARHDRQRRALHDPADARGRGGRPGRQSDDLRPQPAHRRRRTTDRAGLRRGPGHPRADRRPGSRCRRGCGRCGGSRADQARPCSRRSRSRSTWRRPRPSA